MGCIVIWKWREHRNVKLLLLICKSGGYIVILYLNRIHKVDAGSVIVF